MRLGVGLGGFQVASHGTTGTLQVAGSLSDSVRVGGRRGLGLAESDSLHRQAASEAPPPSATGTGSASGSLPVTRRPGPPGPLQLEFGASRAESLKWRTAAVAGGDAGPGARGPGGHQLELELQVKAASLSALAA